MKTKATPGPWELHESGAIVGPKIDDKPIWLRPVIARFETGVKREDAAEYVWFDMGTLARYSIDWKRTQPNLPFDRVAICGRDKFCDRFLVLCDHADDVTNEHRAAD